MKPKRPAGPPMTLGNTRELVVHLAYDAPFIPRGPLLGALGTRYTQAEFFPV